jgi:hypothetical protein
MESMSINRLKQLCLSRRDAAPDPRGLSLRC